MNIHFPPTSGMHASFQILDTTYAEFQLILAVFSRIQLKLPGKLALRPHFKISGLL